MSVVLSSPAPAEDQPKLLDEILSVVKVQAHQMKKCLDNNKLMEGLKHASNMLAELRTSALMPKNYYELYMAIFDALRHLTIYLTEAHNSGRHHLADLYELVQYAGNIVPRLYLMITVGAVYMSMSDAPVREVMRDMIEMSRGVQHPMRGLFLRYYLSSNTRDSLPVGESPGPEGNVHESIHFILTNFTEMNKLWVRLQHQGHSRDREKREAERNELRILVGTNLVRLSQLEGVDLRVYQSLILPGILDQIVSCRDIIAQEYLMEIIIQVFPDDFHLRTLEQFLSATAQLHAKVNVKQIIIALIDRLAAYAAREAEAEGPPENRKLDEEEARRVAAEKKKDTEKQVQEPSGTELSLDVEEKETKEKDIEVEGNTESELRASESDQVGEEGVQEPKTEPEVEPETEKPQDENIRKIRGIPEDVELFVVFWAQIVELVKARPDLSIQDLTALLVSLINLSVSCYPEKLEYVDQILAYAKDKVAEHSNSPDLHSKITEANLLSLLLAPIQEYTSVLTLLVLTHYQPLLALQSFATRRAVAQDVISSIVKNETVISTPEDANNVLDLCGVMLRDQKDAPMTINVSSPMYGASRARKSDATRIEQEELAEEQGWIAKILHLFKSDEEDTQFLLLSAARKQLSEGGSRIRYTFPALVVSAVRLARRYKHVENKDETWEKKITTLFRFMHQVISVLHSRCECSEICLRLFLLAGQSADECGFEEIAYEFFVQAFTIYEEFISESRAQFQAITYITSVLQQTRIFLVDNYDTLITKTALHSAKLLKKPDQCRAVYLSSHLWWTNEREDDTEPYRNGKRALECLQKALKIADSCMDPVTNIELFVEILNRYIYHFEKGNESITAKYLNGLIDLINTNLTNMENPDQHPPASNSSSLVKHVGSVSEYVLRHFQVTINHLRNCQGLAQTSNWQGRDYNEIDLSEVA